MAQDEPPDDGPDVPEEARPGADQGALVVDSAAQPLSRPPAARRSDDEAPPIADPAPDAQPEAAASETSDEGPADDGHDDRDHDRDRGGNPDAEVRAADPSADEGAQADETSADASADTAGTSAPATPAEASAPATPAEVPASAPPATPPEGQRLPGDPDPQPLPARTVARGRLGHAMRPRATRAQLLAGLLCALLGFALVVQARQTQTQGLETLRQADLVRLLDNVTNAEARAEQDVRDEQAIRDRLLSGSGSSQAAQEAAQQRLDTLGILAGTVPASGPGIELEIVDPRRQVDASVLLDTLEELRDGGAEVIQIGPMRVVAATAFTDEADGVRVDGRLLTPPYTYKVIGDPQTLSRLLQIPGGVLDVLHSKGAQGKVTQPSTVTVEALRPAAAPQYARPAPGPTP